MGGLMLVFRILGTLVIVTVGVSLLVFVVTRDRRWLRFGWLALKIGGIILLILLTLFVLERSLVVI